LPEEIDFFLGRYVRPTPGVKARSAAPFDSLVVMHEGGVRDISAVEALELVRSSAILLDVREDHEWAAGHAPDAMHIPMSRIAEQVASLPTDRTIVCVCHVGARSAAVGAALLRGGWHALNVAGGMEAWVAAGLPVVDDLGRPGAVV
jgi:rhodanese-related sulfurtransferase